MSRPQPDAGTPSQWASAVGAWIIVAVVISFVIWAVGTIGAS